MAMPKFDPTINLGHIISIFGVVIPFCSWIVLSNGAFDRRLSVLEKTVQAVTETISQNDARTREQLSAIDQRNRESDQELRTGIRRLDDKISALLIRGLSPTAPPVVLPPTYPNPPATVQPGPRR